MRVQYVYKNPRRARYGSSNCWWWFFWIVMLGFLITFLVLAITAPRDTYHYYRRHAEARTCTPSERFDDDLGLCAPVTHTPVPVSAEMMDTSQSPCNSFYRYMNGRWLRNHTNENRAFGYVWRKNRKEVHDIIKDPASGPIYDFYRSCVDTLVHGQHRFETSRQTKHVREHILGALHTHADLPVVLGRLAKYGFNSIFSITVEPHPTKKAMLPLFRHDTVPGFGSELAKQLNAWHAEPEPDMNFSDYVLKGHFDKDTVQMSALREWAPKDFWRQFLREINGVSMLELDLEKGGQEAWMIDQPYFRKVLGGLYAFPIQEWKLFVEASIKHNMDNFLPTVPSDSYFRQHQPVGRGVRLAHRLPRHEGEYSEEQCIAITHKLLPGAIAKVFLHRDMPRAEETRGRVVRVVDSLRDAYAQIVHETPWLSEETRNRAVDKINAIKVRAVHPTHWAPEPFLTRISRDRFLRNLNFVRRYRVQRNYELWTITRKQVDADSIQRFGAPLTTVNAYYSMGNTITIFAGILREPFYSRQYNDVGLYGLLGLVCGHEFSHALDPTGRQYDKNGSLVKWWTDADVAAFKKRAQCVVDEYGPPSGCQNANYGTQTLGEDVADITGIAVAWRAFNNMNPTASDNEKRQFFQVFAQIWAESYDQEHLCARANSDVHAVSEMRVDQTLRQMPEFARLFKCRRGDRMINMTPCKIYG